MKFKLKDIKPNPYRDLLRFPVQTVKVATLVRSIKATGFWPTLVARIRDNKPQIAFGHNRLAALKEVYGKNHEIPLTIEDRSDADFLKMMELENSEEYGNDVSSTIQSVRSVVKAFADGEVQLPPIIGKVNKDHIRYAPSFVKGVCSGNLPEHAYTAITLAVFFECEISNTANKELSAPHKIQASLAALELEEMKVTSDGLGFDAKSLERFRIGGKIPAKRLLDAAREIEVKVKLIKAREEVHAKQVLEDGKAIEERLKAIKAEEEAAEKEHQRLVASRKEALKQKAAEKAERIKADLEEKTKRDAEREERRKAEEKEWKANQKEREKSARAQIVAKERQEEAAAARWQSESQTLIDSLDRILSDEDTLHDRLKTWVRDRRVTDNQRGLLKLALLRVSSRAANFNPEPTKPAQSAKEK